MLLCRSPCSKTLYWRPTSRQLACTVRLCIRPHCKTHTPPGSVATPPPVSHAADCRPPRTPAEKVRAVLHPGLIQMSTLPPKIRKSSVKAPVSTVKMAATKNSKPKAVSKANNGVSKSKSQMHRRSRTGTLLIHCVARQTTYTGRFLTSAHLHATSVTARRGLPREMSKKAF